MSISALNDQKTIRKALDLVGAELRTHKVLGEIMVCGGRAFLLRYSRSDDGRSIETSILFDGNNGLVRQVAERAGRIVGLPETWLHDLLPVSCQDWASRPGGFPAGMYPTWERPGLRVVAAGPHLLLSIMFLASLDPAFQLERDDLDAAAAMAIQAGIRTFDHLKTLARPLHSLVSRRTGEKESAESELLCLVGTRLSYFAAAMERAGGGLVLKATPSSLAEVTDLIREDKGNFGPAPARFAEAFYLQKDGTMKQAMLDPEPVPTGDAEIDVWIGALGEHLAQRWELQVPAWTQEAAFMGGSVPVFYPDLPVSRGIQIVETPPAYRRRLLFTRAEPLMNVKFPQHMTVRMPFWS